MQLVTHQISRRTFLLGSMSAAAVLSGCATNNPTAEQMTLAKQVQSSPPIASDPELQARYAAFEDGGHFVPAIPYQDMDPKYYRQRVADPTGEKVGTVVVDTPNRFLYLVEEGGTAMRYGVGIGRDGFAWKGEGIIHWRQPWPRWKPPAEMIARQPELEIYSVANGGMDPGIMNPLGARALYIFQNRQDTLYRLHGSPEWQSIGKSVSSGCVRLINHDIVDLYARVPYHARIVVHQEPFIRMV
ncbi:L,D-transpeptidase family protein [Sinorhizobium medicae]|uniref:L,D-transpeptidase family protein n=1 Tax=Sinorhizobium medicae TaxID=110321 RepID=UPI00040B31A3|nr:L,D-transpeptidase [Sinorhizobium medicae]MDX0855208.1 L,D-transpeptidase family protein [Sinorhizobium medicae]MDX0954912.1 L,D-transpeptidase family protein [Sinorhizobium medicae]MDX1066187.1 L,D-transpeptidase family protein [Sinorhizobium medicae]MDX1083972.1 L,D-transpeptidase family protein [Sinorhizobium medicae]MDX1210288.1 L,D-transpeptidase family protein [Sinorhizobium medicae]